MGNIKSYCCKDEPDGVVDEQEEQSRIWSENGSNQQYGACSPPKSPIVYNIVLPRLVPIEIENYNFIEHQLDLSLTQPNNTTITSSGSQISGSTNIDSSVQRSVHSPTSDLLGLNQSKSESRPTSPSADIADRFFSDEFHQLSTDTTKTSLETDTNHQQQQQKQKGKKSNKSNRHSNYDPKRPAVIKEEYCPEQFENLRALVLSHPDGQKHFRELLWSCIPWSAPGGKSGSTFLKTVNDQFILKEMSKLELQSFLSIANEYFNYVESAYRDNKPSLLSTIFGIYRIVYTSSPTQAGTEYYFMVMKNLFYKRTICQRFDLKGSVRNRLTDTSDPDNTEHVLMDENLLLIACDHPLFIHARSKQILNECINIDSKFLASIAVMDYSLLVGVDKENQELVLGIIDYVRPFTWDKKIERVVKSVVSSELPTIIEPGLYRERFCEAMDKYFESVPDDWVC